MFIVRGILILLEGSKLFVIPMQKFLYAVNKQVIESRTTFKGVHRRLYLCLVRLS